MNPAIWCRCDGWQGAIPVAWLMKWQRRGMPHRECVKYWKNHIVREGR